MPARRPRTQARHHADDDLPGARRTAGVVPLAPQLATLVDEVPAGDDWLHEIKYDGYRLLCVVDGGKARLVTRNGNDWTDRVPGVAAQAAALPVQRAVLDGEVLVLDRHGRSDFQALQQTIGRPGQGHLHYFVFDLLQMGDADLRDVPLIARKEALRRLLQGSAQVLRYADHIEGHGEAFFAAACEQGLEGIVSKRANARYTAGRGRSWLKVKCQQRQEFVVVGWTEPTGSRVGLGALVLGVHEGEGGELRYAGRVGTGFSDEMLRELHAALSAKGMAMREPPVVGAPRSARGRAIHWVRPRMVVEVAFGEWTKDGAVRHPTFVGVRADKRVEEVVREKAR